MVGAPFSPARHAPRLNPPSPTVAPACGFRRVDSGSVRADSTGMPRIEYGVLLVGACLVSFQLGATFGSPAPSPPQLTAPASSDDGRIAALERRVDALAMREQAAPAPATTPLAPREVVDTATPALVDAVSALRDAVLTVGRVQPAAATIGRSVARNPSAVQAVLTNNRTNGPVENCDLLMAPLSQVLDRMGRPSAAGSTCPGRETSPRRCSARGRSRP